MLGLLALLVLRAGWHFLRKLSPARLVDISLVRVSVEITLYGLAAAHLVLELMTFVGQNFDIVAGITAGLVGWLVRRGKVSKTALLVWHLGPPGPAG